MAADVDPRLSAVIDKLAPQIEHRYQSATTGRRGPAGFPGRARSSRHRGGARRPATLRVSARLTAKPTGTGLPTERCRDRRAGRATPRSRAASYRGPRRTCAGRAAPGLEVEQRQGVSRLSTNGGPRRAQPAASGSARSTPRLRARTLMAFHHARFWDRYGGAAGLASTECRLHGVPARRPPRPEKMDRAVPARSPRIRGS